MKKLLTLALALIMALSCVAASAATVYTEIDVDRDVAKDLMTTFGLGEDMIATVDPILALVSALGVKVTYVGGNGQVDIDLNGTDALSLSYATDDAGISVASTLFPNYLVTVSNETVGAIMEQAAANMPGGGEGGAGGMMDMNAMMETFGGYYQRWFEACAAAGKPGDPVTGQFEFEGYTFDTMVPITVDIDAIADATRSLMDELLADPAAMAAIKGMAQGMAQSSGAEFNDANFEEEFKAGFEEWMGQTRNMAPTYYVDITAVFTNKLSTLSFYECQNKDGYLLKMTEKRARWRGRQRVPAVEFAEPFTTWDGRPVKGGVLECLGETAVAPGALEIDVSTERDVP